MTLSTQLTRGTLALPMLALFAALAFAAGTPEDAQARAPRARAVRIVEAVPAQAIVHGVVGEAGRLLVVRVGEAAACNTLPRQALLLSQAPGDLGPMLQRIGEACRA